MVKHSVSVYGPIISFNNQRIVRVNVLGIKNRNQIKTNLKNSLFIGELLNKDILNRANQLFSKKLKSYIINLIFKICLNRANF